MPLKLYNKEKILDACLAVFAEHGYDNTSTAMLAEAAGVSKALLFHHFNSKKELYLSVVERCFEQAKSNLRPEDFLAHDDFFAARAQFSLAKYAFNRDHPHIYKVLLEAYVNTPAELEADMAAKAGAFLLQRHHWWAQLFEKVPLKEGVDRAQAFELVVLALDHFDQKYLAEMTSSGEPDGTYIQQFLAERNNFLKMIRYGIER